MEMNERNLRAQKEEREKQEKEQKNRGKQITLHYIPFSPVMLKQKER